MSIRLGESGYWPTKPHSRREASSRLGFRGRRGSPRPTRDFSSRSQHSDQAAGGRSVETGRADGLLLIAVLMPAIAERQKATRYRTEFDDDDGGAALLAVRDVRSLCAARKHRMASWTVLPAAMGPPAMCCVFLVPDEDEMPSDEVEDILKKREELIGAFRALNLNVEAFSTPTKIYCKLSAPDTMLRFEAETKGVRLRLKEDFG
eukprot:111315-Rhodomonas_salina.1